MKDYVDYDAYLNSPAWKSLRVRAIEKAQGRCQVCNNPNELHVHHRTYERLGHERLEDLTVLCATCHQLFHENRDSVRELQNQLQNYKRLRDEWLKEQEAKAREDEPLPPLPPAA